MLCYVMYVYIYMDSKYGMDQWMTSILHQHVLIMAPIWPQVDPGQPVLSCSVATRNFTLDSWQLSAPLDIQNGQIEVTWCQIKEFSSLQCSLATNESLLGGLVAINFIFPEILGIIIIIPIDELHHFSEGWLNQPPTRILCHSNLLITINHYESPDFLV